MKPIERDLQSLEEPFSIHTPDYIIRYANDAALTLFGLEREEIIGRKCYEVFHDLKGPPPGCPLLNSCEEGKTVTSEMGIPYLPGEYLVTTHPIMDDDGSVRILHFMNNITDIKNKLSDRNRKLSFFTDIITHHMNNHIHGSILALDLYLKSEENDDREKYLHMAREHMIQSKIFLDNVNKLLWIERHPPTRVPVEPLQVIEEAATAVKRSSRKEISIKIREIGESGAVIADELLFDVFINLFNTSARHTPGKRVEMEVLIRASGRSSVCYFEVINRNGRLTEEEKEALSERFMTPSISHDGRGIGLALARKIVISYGGDIRAEEIGGGDNPGTKFVFSLPMA